MENKENIGIEKEFVDEHGAKATIKIESNDGYKVNALNSGKYKLANSKKNNGLLGESKKDNMFTRDISFRTNKNGLFTSDIGLKSSGFAQVASLSFIIALAAFFALYLMFRY